MVEEGCNSNWEIGAALMSQPPGWQARFKSVRPPAHARLLITIRIAELKLFTCCMVDAKKGPFIQAKTVVFLISEGRDVRMERPVSEHLVKARPGDKIDNQLVVDKRWSDKPTAMNDATRKVAVSIVFSIDHTAAEINHANQCARVAIPEKWSTYGGLIKVIDRDCGVRPRAAKNCSPVRVSVVAASAWI